ncbi:hypothetical protein BKP35_10785 [Anaerobacillus arseniciselenatis]|uniref:DUF4367 domain-containing protein n=1 Tax=Anaerobacillus arseniciselenatis TaxID=85682 RepID=A0A1S2LJJ4_9BACI|nr:hypothetical protein [Anaerobacillus arseniciselenatis]OIJ12283.1 hypothetical protein BKP35_10785 [Anaerobacillus arseniciselenatis]
MKKDNFDKKVKDSFIEGTDYDPKLKDDIWNNIEKEIENEQSETINVPTRTRAKGKKKRGYRKVGMLASMAASLVLALTLVTTDTGSAFIDQVRQMFEPEKTVTEQIEGIENESDVSLHEGQAGYVIYFDKEMYSMIDVEGKDRIIFNEELPEIYPEVYMEISQTEESALNLATKMYEQLQQQYPKVLEVDEVEWPIESFVVHAVGGTGGYEWDDPVVRYYFFSNEQGGSFVVKQKYFLEAGEGHGARFEHMLEQFYMYDASEN